MVARHAAPAGRAENPTGGSDVVRRRRQFPSLVVAATISLVQRFRRGSAVKRSPGSPSPWCSRRAPAARTPPPVADAVVFPELTPREVEILRLIDEQVTNPEITGRLELSERPSGTTFPPSCQVAGCHPGTDDRGGCSRSWHEVVVTAAPGDGAGPGSGALDTCPQSPDISARELGPCEPDGLGAVRIREKVAGISFSPADRDIKPVKIGFRKVSCGSE